MTTELEAIQQDVSTEDNNLVPVDVVEATEEVSLSPREAKMKEITERRNAEYENNNGEVASFDPSLISGIGVEDKTIVIEEPAKPNSPFYQNDDGSLVMKIKVNGVESERTVEQIVATAQKHESADQKLQAIHDRQVELDERERQQDERDSRIAAKAEQEEHSQPSEQDADNEGRRQLLKEAAESLFEGDAEAYADKTIEAEQGRQQPTQDTRQIIDQAKSELNQERVEEARKANAEKHNAELSRFEDSRQGGIKWLAENYPDVDDSKRLTQLVNKETDVIIKAGSTKSPMEIIQEATETVVKRAGLNNTTVQPSDRSNNKTEMRQPPMRQSGAVHVQPRADEIDMSPKAVIARKKAHNDNLAGKRV